MSIKPQGDELRAAVKWISDERIYHPEKSLQKLVQEACLKFDLSPRDAGFLARFEKEESDQS